MKLELKQHPFDKVMMTGVFIGIISTVLSIFYDMIFLESTGFPYTAIINVSSLIFSLNILFPIIAAIYYGFERLTRYGNILFITLFALATIILLLIVRGVDRTEDRHLNIEFRQLLSGIILIAGIGAVLVPFLLENKKFKENVI
jgi:hypothetical protein